MGEFIYDNVISNESEGMNRERMEMMVAIYECADSVRDHDFRTETNTHQQLQHTGNKCVRMRSYRSVTVCLVLLCVLLLTAVIVLCVLINTNNHQCHIKTKKLTEERDQLLTKYTNITEERDELIAKYNNVTKLNEHMNQEKNKLWTQLYAGWIYNQSSLYFISSEKKNWSESRRYCRERGADLIIINNKEEKDFIKKNSGNDKLWIGLTDSDEEKKWKWVDGSTLNSDFWRSGEPNGGGRENCVVSYSSEWADYPCTTAFKWICERAQ